MFYPTRDLVAFSQSFLDSHEQFRGCAAIAPPSARTQHAFHVISRLESGTTINNIAWLPDEVMIADAELASGVVWDTGSNRCRIDQ